ncbi:hypothetical protein GCM10022421_31580 [Oceanisphaera sediminis]|uniref:Uncharacterized protein n=1 Tax=Oceanisphaera sediminis TaxID=981381 RepID=A0ABP7ERV6_9GAMM
MQAADRAAHDVPYGGAQRVRVVEVESQAVVFGPDPHGRAVVHDQHGTASAVGHAFCGFMYGRIGAAAEQATVHQAFDGQIWGTGIEVYHANSD